MPPRCCLLRTRVNSADCRLQNCTSYSSDIIYFWYSLRRQKSNLQPACFKPRSRSLSYAEALLLLITTTTTRPIWRTSSMQRLVSSDLLVPGSIASLDQLGHTRTIQTCEPTVFHCYALTLGFTNIRSAYSRRPRKQRLSSCPIPPRPRSITGFFG